MKYITVHQNGNISWGLSFDNDADMIIDLDEQTYAYVEKDFESALDNMIPMQDETDLTGDYICDDLTGIVWKNCALESRMFMSDENGNPIVKRVKQTELIDQGLARVCINRRNETYYHPTKDFFVAIS